MSTRATEALRWLSQRWEEAEDHAHLRDDTATQSGIVGDLAHRKTGGYHISRQDQSKTNFSVVRPDDRPGCGPDDAAAAIDMTYARTEDLIACHLRLREVFNHRFSHPAARYLNAWNGWDGNGGAGRYDLVTGIVSSATSDHKSHIHLEFRRRYCEDMDAMRTVLAVVSPKGANDMGALDGIDPYDGKTPQAAELRDLYFAVVHGARPAGSEAGGVVSRLERLEASAAALTALAQAPRPATLSAEDRQQIALMVSQEIGGKLDRLLAAMGQAGDALGKVDDQ